MAGQAPNSANIERVSRAASSRTNYVITHPEYQYYYTDWYKIRDCIAGQREIKKKSEVYLRRQPKSDEQEYKEYLDDAIFFNMTAQTLNGMTGQVFRRIPSINALSPALKKEMHAFGKDGSTHIAFAKTVVAEQCAMGRYGVLVDAPTQGIGPKAQSYAVGYQAENILDWTIEAVNGQNVLTRVLLREFIREMVIEEAGAATTTSDGRKTNARTTYAWPYYYKARYRELLLIEDPDSPTGYGYYQNVYGDGGPSGAPIETFRPEIRGNPIPYIPFVFFGASGNQPDVEKPPLLDIADLNVSHYKTYAELEAGRRYIGLPIYVAPGGASVSAQAAGSGVSEYHLGPNTVWEVPNGAQPTILECKGEGLKGLERALSTKEGQIAAIGGRLLPGMGQGTSESDNQSALREASEQSILLNVILAAQDGMSLVVRYWAAWRDVPFDTTTELRYIINTDFLTQSLDARVLRAMQLMWESGLAPIEVLYDFLRSQQVLDDTWTLELYIQRMQDPTAFLNNPDAMARQKGFDSRKQELDEEARKIEQDFQQDEIELQKYQLGMALDASSRAGELHSEKVAQTQIDVAQSKTDLASSNLALAAQKRAASPGAKTNGLGGTPMRAPVTPAAQGGGVNLVTGQPDGTPFKNPTSVPKVQKPSLTPKGATGATPKPGGPTKP